MVMEASEELVILGSIIRAVFSVVYKITGDTATSDFIKKACNVISIGLYIIALVKALSDKTREGNEKMLRIVKLLIMIVVTYILAVILAKGLIFAIVAIFIVTAAIFIYFRII